MIGYPNKKRTPVQPSQVVSDGHTGRGMSLEHDLNTSNTYYIETNKALIYKKPTPVQVVRVDYPSRESAKIVEAYYKVPSTTDYNGIYQGYAIDFEAKETKSKTSFPFKSIHPHQIQHLKRVALQKGIGFFIIRFTCYDETYLIDANIIITLYEQGNKKSIPYNTVKEVGLLIQQGVSPRLRYLEAVDILISRRK